MEYNNTIRNGILFTHVLCWNKKKVENLGVPEVNKWFPIAVEVDKIHAMKMVDDLDEEEEISHGKTVVYFLQDDFIIDMNFDDAVEIWLTFKKGLLPG